MITGFNTDVDYDGRIFHVQTEDKGRDNPVVESLVYSRGEIVASRNSSYQDLNDSEEYSEDDVMDRMERQHQALIREILNGKFEADGPKPFGHNIISNRSLDEVISEFLVDNFNPEPIRLERITDGILVAGVTATVKLRVLVEQDDRPASGAQVRGSFVCRSAEPQPLFSAPTDAEGFVEATFEIPETVQDPTAVLICEARCGGAIAEIEQPVATVAESV